MRKLWIVLVLMTLVVTGVFGVRSADAANPNGNLTATANLDFRWTMDYKWTIAKTVSPADWTFFRGDSGDSVYTINVTKTPNNNSYMADVSVCVTNPLYMPATGLAINATIRKIEGLSNVIVTSGPVSVARKPVLNTGETFCYKATFNLPDAVPGAQYRLIAKVTATGIGSATPTASKLFPTQPTRVVGESVNVDDSNGMTWPFSDSGSVSYTHTFTCEDEGVNVNTASIRERPNQFSKATVTVACHDLAVTKTAQTWAGPGSYQWSIEKTSGVSELALQAGGIAEIGYTVTLSAVVADSGSLGASGEITISNPAPRDASLVGVMDEIEGGIAAEVTCPAMVVPAGGTLVCAYSAALPDRMDRVNTATATLQNTHFLSATEAVPAGTTDFAGTALVTFANTAPAEMLDACVDVTDDKMGFLGTVCAGDEDKTKEYVLTVGPFECGMTDFANTALFVAKDTQATGSSTVIIPVTVVCEPDENGCTLTQGYWKTHADPSDNKFNETWNQIGGPGTMFYLSNMSWIDVFNTEPLGNGYYILAHQFMAAKLNVLNGASTTPEVDAALAFGESFFATYAPDFAFDDALRAQAIANADILDQYNNGLIGPGHCE